MYPNSFIELIRNELGSKQVNLGDIEIMKRHSIFEVDDQTAKQILITFNDLFIDSRRIFVKVDSDVPQKSDKEKSHSRSGFMHRKGDSGEKRDFGRRDRNDRGDRGGRNDRSDRGGDRKKKSFSDKPRKRK
jgi:hypothetical protein